VVEVRTRLVARIATAVVGRPHPTTIAWVKVDDHWKAVVQIEINGAGDRREIAKYGANHVFLETTTATMGPPPAAPSQPQPVPTPMPTPTPTK
jgi:hypothetical protein